jgi:hypothetical protein
MSGRGAGRGRHEARNARLTGAVGFTLAATLPWLLWHRVIGAIAEGFKLDFKYLISEWSPWALIAAGLLLFVPVVVSAGRDPDSRFYPRARGAYMGWGVTLYILGVVLASQVAQIMRVSGAHY